MNSIDITPVLQIALELLAVIVTAVLVPYIRKKTTVEQQQELDAWVSIAVEAAEQIYAGAGRGEEKKAYVIKWLDERGIKVAADKLDAMIEAAVYRLKDGIILVDEA